MQSSVQTTLHDCRTAAGWVDRLPTICQRITVRRQHNRTIGKLSVWNNWPEQLSPDSPTIGRYHSIVLTLVVIGGNDYDDDAVMLQLRETLSFQLLLMWTCCVVLQCQSRTESYRVSRWSNPVWSLTMVLPLSSSSCFLLCSDFLCYATVRFREKTNKSFLSYVNCETFTLVSH